MDARDTLLLACGPAESRSALRSIFEDSFNLLEADNSHQTKMFLEQNADCIAAVILDITDAAKIDYIIIRQIERSSLLEDIPTIIIANKDTPKTVSTLFDHGATDVYPPDVDPYLLLNRVHNIVELYRHKWHLQDLVDEQAAVLRHSNDAMVDALSSIIEYRSVESGQHILRIRRFTQILLEEVARSCPEYELTPAKISIISSASALHDIGKISIPDAILNKPGKLTADEWETMKSHSITGCRILESLNDIGNQDYLRYAHNICHYHHERWDGKGYPEGLAGDEIPICAQVVGLADAYDALTSKRVYKDAFSFEESVNMILNGDCGIFSPKLLECFKHVSGRFAELAQSYADGASPKAESFDVALPPPTPQDGHDTLQAVQTKYLSMLHYINAAVVEIDLDQGLYHLVYNPDPNLIMLRTNNSYREIQKAIRDHILLPSERERFKNLVFKDIPAFFEDGLHRRSYQFQVRDRATGNGVPYEVTLLRLDHNDPEHRRLIILWKRMIMQAPACLSQTSPASHEESSYGPLFETCCCRNDTYLTLESGQDRLTNLIGHTPEEIRDKFQNRLIAFVTPEDRKLLRQRFNEQLDFGGDVQLTYRLRHKAGHIVWVLHKSQLVVESDGSEHLYSFLSDVTRAKNAQETYRFTLEQYQLILSQTQNIVFEWDLASDTAVFSGAYDEIFGYTPLSKNFLAQLSTHSHLHPDDIPAFFDWLQRVTTSTTSQMVEIRIANSEGRYLWCRHRATAIRDADGKAIRVLGIIININEERQAAQALQQQAEQDQLTRLLNKQTARKQAEDYLASIPDGAHCAMMIIDLDNFKLVNDQYGHMFGDAILTQVARELKKLFRSHDIVARIGGDEFMVLMRDVSDLELVQKRCDKLLSAFENVFSSQDYDCPLGCSIGVSFAPEHGITYSNLFQHADQALYQAKDLGKNRAVFYDSKNPAFELRRQIATVARTQIDSEAQPGLANASIVQYALQHLYSAQDIETAVNDILDLVGRETNVSRVYIFENSADNKTCSNTFEWCNTDIAPEKDNLQNISYETDIPGYEDNFNEQGIFYCADVGELPIHLRDILEPQGIKSLLHCAIRDNGVFRGYIGFDECRTKRLWTKEQIQTLTFFSEMLSTFLLKERAQAETARHVDDLMRVLDKQNAWIYIIDPVTCELKFLNAKTKAIAPHAKIGMRCHEALMNLPARCKGCPALALLEGKEEGRNVFYNDYLHIHSEAEAAPLSWQGQDACLITCRRINEP